MQWKLQQSQYIKCGEDCGKDAFSLARGDQIVVPTKIQSRE